MPALLRIEHLSKVFPGQVALDDVDLTIEAGTTHALVGQNGSGKSTLIKILAGYHQPTGDEATATYYGNDPTGEPLELGDGRAAERDGIRFVHQDLGLVEGLTAVENLALGNGFTTRYGKISWRADVVRARRALAAIGFESVDVKIPVGALAPAQKTGVALARALLGWDHDAHLLVLDEPTASLPARDVRHLFEAIRRLKERGVAILYVSHHLDEVFEIADEVSVLRDGRRVVTERVDSLDHDRLIELMIGHKIVQGRSGAGPAGDQVLVDVRELHGPNLHGVDLQVRAGEVVGVAGITGSGRETLVPLLTGQVPSSAGSVEINGHFVDNYSPGDVLRAGGAFVTADRKGLGVFTLMSVVDNTTICDVGRNARHGRLDKRGSVPTPDCGSIGSASRPNSARTDRHTQRWQPAEGALRARFAPRTSGAHARRTHPGHRRRGQRRDPSADRPIGKRRNCRAGRIDRHRRTRRVGDRVIVMRNGHIVTELVGDDIRWKSSERNSRSPIEQGELKHMTTTSEPVRSEPDAFELGPPAQTWVQKSGLDKYDRAVPVGGLHDRVQPRPNRSPHLDQHHLVLTEKAIVALLALAFLVPLVADTFDLSIGMMMGFSIAITTALAQNTGNPQALNAIIAVVACAAVGLVSGFIVVKLRVNSFIATLGMSQVLAAANILISGNRTINGVLSDATRLRPEQGARPAALLLLRPC